MPALLSSAPSSDADTLSRVFFPSDFANVELVPGEEPFRVAFPPQLTELPNLSLPL